MKNFEDAKKEYQSTDIPKELNMTIHRSIKKAATHTNTANRTSIKRKGLYIAASACVAFTLFINTNASFAESIYSLPIVGQVARLLTLRDYEVANEGYHLVMNTPVLENTNNDALESRINETIQDRMEDIKEEAQERYESNKALSESTDTEDPSYFTVTVDYEIKSHIDNILSFVINKTESYANTYTIQTYYNIDLSTGDDITLEGLLGNDYKDIVMDTIQTNIDTQTKEHPDYMYFDADVYEEYVNDSINFYINSDNQIVLSFDKGTIAPPPMGAQEFVVIQ